MAEGEGQGAAGGSGGEGKGGAGAGGTGAGGAQDKGGAAAAGGQGQGSEGKAGEGQSKSPSLIGAAGLKKDGDGKGGDDKSGQGQDKKDGQGQDGKGKEGKQEDGKQEGAPEEYASFTMPEGMEPDKAVMTEFTGLAKSLDLSQEKAQKLVDFQAKQERLRVDASIAEYDKTTEGWRNETKAELGAKYEAEEGNVARFLNAFGSPELRQLMDATRIGNHKALFKAMAAAGAKLGEGKPPEGQKGEGKKTDGKTFYPEMRQQMKASASK